MHVTSDKPFKTRIAATFSLWMCAFRPVSLKYEKSKDDTNAAKFCAALNFWIATSYLSKFGDKELFVDARFKDHYKRVLHDFTYRNVNLSSLEMLYCGVFRPRSREE